MAAELGQSGDTLGMDLGTTGGNWLFKDQDLLMGPVPARVLIDKLYAGEISPDTPVADADGEEWKRLRDVPFFTVHIARAQARSRVMRDKQAVEARERRHRTVRLVTIGIAAVILVGAVGSGTWWWVVHRSMERSDDGELAELGITLSPPKIALASGQANAGHDGSAWLDVDVAADPTEAAAAAGQHRTAHRGRGHGHNGRSAAKTAVAAASAGGHGGDHGGVGLERNYDMASINRTVRSESRTLFPCIKAEVHRTGFKGQIPFEFVIKNDGHVGKLWIDNKDLRGTPLEACFKGAMARWRFKKFAGERPTVSQSFTVGG